MRDIGILDGESGLLAGLVTGDVEEGGNVDGHFAWELLARSSPATIP